MRARFLSWNEGLPTPGVEEAHKTSQEDEDLDLYLKESQII
jgi:hypothetical protein